MRRLLLVRHAATDATRAAAFPADEPLDERGLTAAARLGPALPSRRRELLSSPALRCRQTAAAAGLGDPAIEPDLVECDFGTWAGRSLADVHAAEPAATAAWMADPEACPHGGESLATFAQRVGRWLDRQAEQDGCAIAVTHGGVVKAAIVRALDAPLAAFWRIDVAPLAVTELHAHDGRWTITRVNWLAGAVSGAPSAVDEAPSAAEAARPSSAVSGAPGARDAAHSGTAASPGPAKATR